MNLILFEEPFETYELTSDHRAFAHLIKVLRVENDSEVYIGFENGPRAKARVCNLDRNRSLTLDVFETEEGPAQLPIHLLIGLPRPHTAQRILQEAASMGVKSIHFFKADKSEPSYLQSRLWQKGEWRDKVRKGVEQSFATMIPEVAIFDDLEAGLKRLSKISSAYLLDNYDADSNFIGFENLETDKALLIIFGPEGGFTKRERLVGRSTKCKFSSLGTHILRLETAVVAAGGIAISSLYK